MKPRTADAILFSVYGPNSMFVLELIDGTLNLTMHNGDGPFSALFIPENGQNLCDGEWHTVTVVKTQAVCTLKVDQISASPQISPEKFTSIDTTRAFVLGGLPWFKNRGLSVHTPFNGCMRNIKIGEDPPININGLYTGNGAVDVGVQACPL